MVTGQVAQSDSEFAAELDRLDGEWFASNGKFKRSHLAAHRLALVLGDTGDDLIGAVREFLSLDPLSDAVQAPIVPSARRRAARVSDPIALAAKRQAAYAALAHGKR